MSSDPPRPPCSTKTRVSSGRSLPGTLRRNARLSPAQVHTQVGRGKGPWARAVGKGRRAVGKDRRAVGKGRGQGPWARAVGKGRRAVGKGRGQGPWAPRPPDRVSSVNEWRRSIF